MEQPKQKFYTSKELIEIFPEAIPYLEDRKAQYDIYLQLMEKIVRRQLVVIQKSDYKWFWEGVIEVFDGKYLEFVEKELKRIDMFLHEPIKGNITQSDIERAREYPFDKLIESNKNYAFCPKHEEKTASFYIKKNYGYCFSCNWSCDTIKYLTEIHGFSFVEAVKRLQ